MKNLIVHAKRLLAAALLAPELVLASAEGPQLDKAPLSKDPESLKRGATIFVTTCMACHSASFMRYNKLTEIGFTEAEIKEKLLPPDKKVGDLMTIAMRPQDAKKWFGGVAPPDLTLVTRQRNSELGSGADWVYTYLRTFYRDPTRPNGWNNVVFPGAGMPHVFWELQGEQTAKITKHPDGTESIELVLSKPGSMSAQEYDKMVADVVSFMQWMGEPIAEKRKSIGIWVMIYLAVFFALAYALKKAYWKDVH